MTWKHNACYQCTLPPIRTVRVVFSLADDHVLSTRAFMCCPVGWIWFQFQGVWDLMAFTLNYHQFIHSRYILHILKSLIFACWAVYAFQGCGHKICLFTFCLYSIYKTHLPSSVFVSTRINSGLSVQTRRMCEFVNNRFTACLGTCWKDSLIIAHLDPELSR